jgi:GT2 family glycosyltransferase
MHNTPNISVVISIWNSNLTLFECLACLDSQTYKDFEIIIIDNGSTDGASEKLKEYSRSNLRLEQLRINSGFARANNIGARLARGRWLALLNADAFPEPDWLEKLLQSAEDNPKFASFSSRQIQANNPELLDGTGDAYHVSGLAWRIGIGYPSRQYGLDATEIFSPCAAAAMYLRETFLEVGGFDEDLFSYFEDIDLGFRFQLRGYRCLYVPGAVVHHIGSATFGARSDFAFYHTHRNLVLTFVKNMPPALFWRYLPAHFVANLIYVVYYTVRGRGRVLWRAKYDAWKELPKFIRKRTEIQKQIRTTDSDLMRVMQHGWLQPYLLNYQMRKVRRIAGFSSDKN